MLSFLVCFAFVLMKDRQGIGEHPPLYYALFGAPPAAFFRSQIVMRSIYHIDSKRVFKILVISPPLARDFDIWMLDHGRRLSRKFATGGRCQFAVLLGWNGTLEPGRCRNFPTGY
ncbi:hypothetical protein CHELA1G11_11539 [Hyphomicrobiales bacterium]|nr:hypothetical protein CHELA1G11_11539 [Hyphomicrobiales bacterium]CAH1667055.1 hypothetical protein CHELA1G2_12770 [Hyphomicrobiales bacterium]